MHDHLYGHSKHGVTGGFPIMGILAALAAGSTIAANAKKIFGKGITHISHGHGPKLSLSRKGGAMSEAESYLVPLIHSIHGNGIGFGGGTGFGGASHHGEGIGFGATGGRTYWEGNTKPTPVQYGANTYPIGGASHLSGCHGGKRKRTTKKHHGHGMVNPLIYPLLHGDRTRLGHHKGGFAIDQMHTNAYSGFTPGSMQAMYPVNTA